MPRLNSIQWKALLMLVTFSVSFTLFCHCAAMAASAAGRVRCAHCHKPTHKQTDESGCQGMQAVRFNLLEKQTADPIHPAPAPLTALIAWSEYPTSTGVVSTEKRHLPQRWLYKHSPPDRLSLYQCFLI